MRFKERLDKFLQLQNSNMKFEDISKELEISVSTLRSFLNKRGYKYDSGKYVLRENIISNAEASQIEFGEAEKKSEDKKIRANKSSKNKTKSDGDKEIKKNKDIKEKGSGSKENSIKSQSSKKKENNIDSAKKKVNTKGKPKKDRKINITQEDLDKLCEVYDWYLEVKDNKSIKLKNSKSNKKDIKIESTEIKNLKSTTIKIDKDVWGDFERLCSNSKYSKQEIITQALLDFMKVYKNLL